MTHLASTRKKYAEGTFSLAHLEHLQEVITPQEVIPMTPKRTRKRISSACRHRILVGILYVIAILFNLMCFLYIMNTTKDFGASSRMNNDIPRWHHGSQTLAYGSGRFGTVERATVQAGLEGKKSFESSAPAPLRPPSNGFSWRKPSADGNHSLAGLSCERYGGPGDDAAEDVVYWSDIKTDSTHQSPFRDDRKEKFITFEPDVGGWNNIRMAMETIVVIAHAMGRTLVLPPEKHMYRLGDKKYEQKTDFSFSDFFHIETISAEHEGLNIITMEEFLTREAMRGNLVHQNTTDASKPPENRVDWNGIDLKELWTYLRGVGYDAAWDFRECVAAFPATASPNNTAALRQMMDSINAGRHGPVPGPMDFVGNPVPVNAPAIDRLKEIRAGRTKLCVYDEAMQSSPLVHFKVDVGRKGGGVRLLTHFYAFVFFEDWRHDLWAKRFVRDHLRYLDEIMCAAARVVQALRARARSKSPDTNPMGMFHSFHIRRGDFQYKNTRVGAKVLFENSKQHLEEGTTLYVATDEKNRQFFNPLNNHYDLCFLDDFRHLFPELNTNYYGMLDQLVASRGEVFYGTFFSTFTAYINRLRGYHSVKKNLEGHDKGIIRSYYFVPDTRINDMQEYKPVQRPIFAREFPVAWRDIDKGVSDIGITKGSL